MNKEKYFYFVVEQERNSYSLIKVERKGRHLSLIQSELYNSLKPCGISQLITNYNHYYVIGQEAKEYIM